MDLVGQQEHKFQDFLLQTMGDDLILLGAWEPVMTAERVISRVFVPVDATVDQMVIVKVRNLYYRSMSREVSFCARGETKSARSTSYHKT